MRHSPVFDSKKLRRARLSGVLMALVVFTGLGATIGVALGSDAASATTVVRLYVTKSGSGTACTKAHPCGSVQRAATDSLSSNYALEAVVIHVGAGTFATNVCMFDQSNACNASKVSSFKSLLIEGAGLTRTILDGGGRASVFAIGVDTNTVTIEAVTVRNGSASSASWSSGGGLQIGGNTVNLVDTRFVGNSASSSGGAIQVDGGSLTVQKSTISGNSVTASGSGSGGALDVVSNGHVVVEDSTITGNTVTAVSPNTPGATGGAIAASDETSVPLKILDSTISGNSAVGNPEGGGLYANDGAVDLIGSTLSGNSASGGAGGALYSSGSSSKLQLGASVISGNTPSSSTCASANGGVIADKGHNVADSDSCGLGSSSVVISTGAIALQPLASNGGPTQTQRILRTSAAHDVMPKATSILGYDICSRTDQRGVPRQQGPAAHCDAGAYQFAPPKISSVTPNDGAPGTKVTVKGYGFDFVSATIHGSHAASSVSKFVTLTVTVPAVSPGSTELAISNVDGQASSAFTVFADLVVTTSSLPSGTVGHSYSSHLSATGGESPYTWRVKSGHLPPGLKLSSGGVVSGSPTTAGSYSFTVAVTDANHLTRTRSLTIVVKA